MQEYLPSALHAAFLETTIDFVQLPWKYSVQTALEGASQGGSQVNSAEVTHESANNS